MGSSTLYVSRFLQGNTDKASTQSNGNKAEKNSGEKAENFTYHVQHRFLERICLVLFPAFLFHFVDICTCYIVYAPFAPSTGQWFTRTSKNFEGKIVPYSSLLERRPNVVQERHTSAVEKFNRIRASGHLTN